MTYDKHTLGKRKPQHGASRSTDLLEVEDDEARETRWGNLLAERAAEDALQMASAKKARGGHCGELPLRLGRLNEPIPTAETTSNLLTRLDAFLPSLKASNEALLDQAARDPKSVDIEHLTAAEEGMEPEHIEMNLGLGVFTLKTDAKAADAPMESGSTEEEDSDDEESDDDRTETSNTSEDASTSSSHNDITDSAEDSQADSQSSSDQADNSSHDGDGHGETVAQPMRHRPPAV